MVGKYQKEVLEIISPKEVSEVVIGLNLDRESDILRIVVVFVSY